MMNITIKKEKIDNEVMDVDDEDNSDPDVIVEPPPPPKEVECIDLSDSDDLEDGEIVFKKRVAPNTNAKSQAPSSVPSNLSKRSLVNKTIPAPKESSASKPHDISIGKRVVPSSKQTSHSSTESSKRETLHEKQTVPSSKETPHPSTASSSSKSDTLPAKRAASSSSETLHSSTASSSKRASKEPPQGASSSNKRVSDTKKTDYFNIDSSSDSSDEEEDEFHKKVHNLLNSAAVLNDLTSGPLRKEKEEKIEGNSSDSSSSFKPVGWYQPDGPAPVPAVPVLPPDPYLFREDEAIREACGRPRTNRIPTAVYRLHTYKAHFNSITELDWGIAKYSHLLISSSSDGLLKIWDVCANDNLQAIKFEEGLKAAKWSLGGREIIAGGYGKKACVLDAATGAEVVSYDVFNYVSCIALHPDIEDVFICGLRNAILGYDLRVNSLLPIRSFFKKCDDVLDATFLSPAEFACSTSYVSRDSADTNIMVWDFGSGSILSNQIFEERYTCPSLKVNLLDSSFLAQTNGDYIAAFSTERPYKIQNKRYMGHKVAGYGVEFDISPDGQYVASGDSDGDIYFYNYRTTELVKKLQLPHRVCVNKIKWHPVLPSVLAFATTNGNIQIWK